jgi:hypothetical protein
MDPLQLVGIPDWRSAVIAVIFLLIWLVPLGWGWLRSPWLWLAFVMAGVLFPFSIGWVQVTLESLVDSAIAAAIGAQNAQAYILITALPTLILASVVQEGVKALVAIFAIRRAGRSSDPRQGLAFGAAAGAGYGGFEAFWVFNLVFAATGLTAPLAVGGLQAALPFIERFFAVPFHVGSGALSGYGYVTGRFWRFWLLAVALHTVINYSVVLVQARVFDIIGLEIWAAVFGLVTVGIALYLRWRADYLATWPAGS